MIPADILTALIVLLIFGAPFVVLAGLGAKIAAKRARLVEPGVQYEPLIAVDIDSTGFTGKVTVVSNEPDLRYRKIQISKAGDMTPGG